MDSKNLDKQAKLQARLLAEAEQCGKDLGRTLWQLYRIHPDDVLTQIRQDPELLARLRAQKPVDADGMPISRIERDLRSIIFEQHNGEPMSDTEPDVRDGLEIDFMRTEPHILRARMLARSHNRKASSDGWLPIDDAPMDGTEVQLLVFDWGSLSDPTRTYECARFINDGTGYGWRTGPYNKVIRQHEFIVNITHYKPIQPAI